MSALGPLEAETCRDYVVPRLEEAGWTSNQIIEQYPISHGRIVVLRGKHRRGDPLRADYLLEIAPGFPVAVVEAKREYRLASDGLQQAMRYAELLDLPLAYATNGKGIVEHDFDTGTQKALDLFPTPSEAWARFRAWKGIRDDGAAELLLRPFTRRLRNPDGTVKEPRSYQRVAIERALGAILAGRKRALLTLATGTGKTFVALQLIWKLTAGQWPAQGRNPRILYLADRNILVDQPITREFRPVFGDAIWKIQGDIKTGREIYFALYQALADTADGVGIFHDYPPDYFDLIVVDECHRGSARDDSSWRGILEHFADATQLGMTATPLREDNRDTYAYFGLPLYEYSLKQGIDDGFLAPYRVRRVVLSPDAYGWEPDQGQLDLFGREIPPDLYETRHFERVVSLLARTEVAAKHLTEYLKRTDRMAKTIVFCVDSEHADQMRAALHRANSDLTRQYPHYVARIVSAEGDVGKEHLGNFGDVESDTPVIATTSKLLSTGVDLPTVKNIVLFRPVGSIVEFKQIIGRGTRLYPDADKLSFEIIDYSGATALFEDPNFDGLPELVIDEEIDDEGEVIGQTGIEEQSEGESDEAGTEIDEDELRDHGGRKLYVDESDVWVTAEGFYLPDSDSGKLKLVDYADYVAGYVRRLFASPTKLRQRWRNPDDRQQIEELLGAKGISFVELAERLGHSEADPLDLLVFVAWNGPVVSRRDRANRLHQENGAFLEGFVPDARAILEELLEKYAEHGIGQLDDLHILEVPPLTQFGTPVEIAGRFGGPDELRLAVERLEELLYTT
jgi:type I restriction enzyme, R subunit